MLRKGRVAKTSVELVKIEEEYLQKMRDFQYFKYRVKIPSSVLKRFDSLDRAYYHAEQLFRTKYNFSSVLQFEDGINIVSPIDADETILYSFGKEGDANKLDIMQLEEKFKLNFADPNHFRVLIRFFYQSLTNSLSQQGYYISGRTAVNREIDLLKNIHHYSKNELFRKIQNFIHLHPAFDFQLRKFGKNFFLQISPRSFMEFEKDLYTLQSDGIFLKDEFKKIFESVSLPIGRTAKFYSILKKKVIDPITEKPFDENSFLEFAKRMYPTLEFKKQDADLIVVLPYGSATEPWYFSSELVKPSLRFQDIASWDYYFYITLLSETKNHSAQRKDLIEKYLKTIKINFLNIEIGVSNELLSYEKPLVTLQPSGFHKKLDLPVFILPNPWVSFRNKQTNRIVHVNRDMIDYLGATVDLLKHKELTCLDSPSDIKIKIISDESLYKDAGDLVKAIVYGFGGYRGFEQIFGSKLIYDEVIPIKNLLSYDVYTDISPNDYDCVLVFGPRRLPEDFEKTKMIYTFPETEILKRGVPAQFIANDPRPDKRYDKSLRTKSNDPHALFGIGLNILGKIGAKVMALSNETTNYFIPKSVVIGYNIARIFEPLTKDVSQEKSPRELIRRSTPLAAPMVIMSEDGSEIVLQDVYQLPDEVSLFRDDRAERIIDQLSRYYSNIIIHKDGRFYPDELNDIRNIQEPNRSIIPVSIISSMPPRLFSSLTAWKLIPKMGTAMKLSSVDFLISTPLTTPRYKPEARGWPNTILVTIHEEALKTTLSSEQKMQILYQIWALTRVHMGSQLPTRKPISIHYSDSMAKFLRKVGDPRPEYFKYFGTKRNRYGYIPKIFL